MTTFLILLIIGIIICIIINIIKSYGETKEKEEEKKKEKEIKEKLRITATDLFGKAKMFKKDKESVTLRSKINLLEQAKKNAIKCLSYENIPSYEDDKFQNEVKELLFRINEEIARNKKPLFFIQESHYKKVIDMINKRKLEEAAFYLKKISFDSFLYKRAKNELKEAVKKQQEDIRKQPERQKREEEQKIIHLKREEHRARKSEEEARKSEEEARKSEEEARRENLENLLKRTIKEEELFKQAKEEIKISYLGLERKIKNLIELLIRVDKGEKQMIKEFEEAGANIKILSDEIRALKDEMKEIEKDIEEHYNAYFEEELKDEEDKEIELERIAYLYEKFDYESDFYQELTNRKIEIIKLRDRRKELIKSIEILSKKKKALLQNFKKEEKNLTLKKFIDSINKILSLMNEIEKIEDNLSELGLNIEKFYNKYDLEEIILLTPREMENYLHKGERALQNVFQSIKQYLKQ